MNITLEIANETIMGFTQICNVTLWEQVKTEIIAEMIIKATTISGWLLVIGFIAYVSGWFLAGWYKRKSGGRE